MYKPPKAGPLVYLRSALFWLVMVIVFIFFSVTGLLAALFPFKPRYKYLSLAPRLCIYALRWICGVRYVVEHEVGSMPTHPSIVYSNHQSTWETFAFTFLFPPQVWVLKKSLLKVPFFGWGISLLRPIAIDRAAGGKALDQVVEQGRERLDNDIWVVIFPEGTRVPIGGKRRFKNGGAYLAEKTGYPVIPVAHNAGRCWPKDSFLKYPGLVTVKVGEAIQTESKSAEEINDEAESWIRQQLVTLDKG